MERERRKQGTGGRSMGRPVRTSGVAAGNGGLRSQTEDWKTEDRRPEAGNAARALGQVNWVQIHYYVESVIEHRRGQVGFVTRDFGDAVEVSYGLDRRHPTERCVFQKREVRAVDGVLPEDERTEYRLLMTRAHRLVRVCCELSPDDRVHEVLRKRMQKVKARLDMLHRSAGIKSQWAITTMKGGAS